MIDKKWLVDEIVKKGVKIDVEQNEGKVVEEMNNKDKDVIRKFIKK